MVAAVAAGSSCMSTSPVLVLLLQLLLQLLSCGVSGPKMFNSKHSLFCLGALKLAVESRNKCAAARHACRCHAREAPTVVCESALISSVSTLGHSRRKVWPARRDFHRWCAVAAYVLLGARTVGQAPAGTRQRDICPPRLFFLVACRGLSEAGRRRTLPHPCLVSASRVGAARRRS